jgi:hypothetical protein
MDPALVKDRGMHDHSGYSDDITIQDYQSRMHEQDHVVVADVMTYSAAADQLWFTR